MEPRASYTLGKNSSIEPVPPPCIFPPPVYLKQYLTKFTRVALNLTCVSGRPWTWKFNPPASASCVAGIISLQTLILVSYISITLKNTYAAALRNPVSSRESGSFPIWPWSTHSAFCGIGTRFRNWYNNPGKSTGDLNQGGSTESREETQTLPNPPHLEGRACQACPSWACGLGQKAPPSCQHPCPLPKMTQPRKSESEIKSRCVWFESTPSPQPQPPVHLDHLQAASHGNTIGQDSQIPHAWPSFKPAKQKGDCWISPIHCSLNNPSSTWPRDHVKHGIRARPWDTGEHLTLASGFINWASVTT